jgi:hypothetical protein
MVQSKSRGKVFEREVEAVSLGELLFQVRNKAVYFEMLSRREALSWFNR